MEKEKPKEEPKEQRVAPVAVKSSPAREGCGYVYIMKSGKYCKIGMTSRKAGRIDEIKGLFPILRLIHQIACKDPGLVETYLHRKYKQQRVKREWYQLGKEDLQWFKSLSDHDLDENAKQIKRY